MFAGLAVKVRLSMLLFVFGLGIEAITFPSSSVMTLTCPGRWPAVVLPLTIQYWKVYPALGVAVNTKFVPLGYAYVPAAGFVVPPIEGSIITMAVSLVGVAGVGSGAGVGSVIGAKTAW